MTESIAQFLQAIGLAKYEDVFGANEIDLEAAAYLSEDDLKELGLPMGPRRKFAAAIARLENAIGSAQEAPEPTRTATGAERRQLTLMFCDLVGSTSLASTLDPEDLRELMGRYQDAVASCVARYEGHVAKYLGDGVLAYFGWPQAYEDQAERAVRSSMDAVAAVGRLEFRDGLPLAARAGIATGQVVVGDLLGEVAADAQAVSGKTPNLAARLQDIAAPGDVVIDTATRRMLAAAFELTDLGQQSLKGFDTPVEAWRIERESEATDRFDAVHAGRLTRLVGRDHELGLILERWREAQQGRGQVVALSGEAGFGKSRMIRPFRASIVEVDHVQITYQCSPLHANTPLHPVVRQLGRAAGFADADGARDKVDKLERLIAETTDDVASAMPVFLALMSLPIGEAFTPLHLDPPQLRSRIITVLVDQALTLSRNRPLLLIVEDVHWIDPTTEEFITELIASLASASILVLITQRPEYRPPWAGDIRLTTVVLNRLGRDQSAEIVRSIAGHDVPTQLVDGVIDRAGGVPLYLEELTKSVLERDGAYQGGDNLEVPETLQASLLARLDRLGEAKEVAQIGAVIGREFDRGLLEDVAGMPAERIDAALTALANTDLLLQRGTLPNGRYVFKHALIQDAAYDSLLVRRRRELHQRVVTVMSRAGDQEKDAQIEALAYHARKGELWYKALDYYRRAGKRANERSAHHEALRFMEAGLAAAEHLQNNRETVEQVLDICMNLRPSLGAFGMYERLLEALSEANRLADEIGQGAVATIANINKTHVLHHLGRVETGIAVGEETVDLATRYGDRGMLIAASAVLAMGYFFHGEIERAAGLASEHAEELATTFRYENLATTATSSVNWLGNLSGMLSCLGRYADGDRWSNEALCIASETGKPFDDFHAKQWRSNFLIESARAEEAIALLEPLCAVVEEHDLGFGRSWAYGWLGDGFRSIGDFAKAEEALLYANDAARRLNLRLSESWNLLRLADVCVSTGRAQEALAHIDVVERRGQDGGDWWHKPYMLRLRARALTELGDLETAQRTIEAAVDRAEDRGAIPEIAHCRAEMAAILTRRGNSSSARRAKDAAAKAYERLGVSAWQEAL